MTADEERRPPATQAHVERAEFVRTGRAPASVRPEVAASWARSLDRVTSPLEAPDSGRRTSPTDEDLALGDLVRRVSQLAGPHAESTGITLVVVDLTGRAVARRASVVQAQQACRVGVAVGADLGEGGLGTTAVGLTMASGEPSRVVGAEHLLPCLVGWTSGAAVVTGHEGRRVGYLAAFEQTVRPAVSPAWLQLLAALIGVELSRAGRPGASPGRDGR